MQTEDLIREILIYIFVCIVVIAGIRHRSIITIIISIIIFIQHSVEIATNKAILSNQIVLIGATVLGTHGYHLNSSIISFAGTYSILSKFKYFNLFGWKLELVKLVVAILCWSLLYMIVNCRKLFYLFKNYREKEEKSTNLVNLV